MNSMTKRISIALASTALAGGALLGAGGSASAATASAPVQHTQYVSATSATSSEQVGRHTDDDHRGQDTVRYVRAADHKGEAASWHGVSAARWYEDQVDEAASWHGVSVARWYEDQVVWSLDHS
ncbi:hypothetical protein AQJ27_40225 [Streptomyces olivochromogenes]|uniref:Uncharacterized protein n=2 Tax=Streptomyces olivochromogenes TaxID=1963 RepID=A0A250VSD6_STROL|nr:hypothetical protein AQJ27_40225 [Streptomyces olivochromogenes]GAX57123.1 hypothetical protein SO3561_08693 [Streptomyces olivochromogenes]